jgi:hypothetical protein
MLPDADIHPEPIGALVTSALRRLPSRISMIVALGAAAAVLLPVSTAQADLINLSACNLSPLSQPFMPWLDPSSYELAPGGDFESSSWQLTGGAQLVPGSESFDATGTQGDSSLSLPAGASAESPVTCVDAAYPTVRMFTSGTGLVAVSVVYGDLAIPAGVAASLGGGWQASLPALTSSALVAATQDGSAPVSIKLTTLLGNVRVDDVFVDPWNRS